MLDVPFRGVSRIIGRIIHKVRGGGCKDSQISLENNLLGAYHFRRRPEMHPVQLVI
jgi:hypothetical protein